MKTTFSLLGAALAVLLANGAQSAESAGNLDLAELALPKSKGQYVEVHIKSNLIGMVARLAQSEEPEVADFIRGLEQIHVSVVGLDDANRAEVQDRIQSLREKLGTGGWEQIVTVKEKDQDVGVYLKTRGDEAVEGIVVTLLEGSGEAVVVNIVGDIRPEKLALVGERFNIEPLKKVGEKLGKS